MVFVSINSEQVLLVPADRGRWEKDHTLSIVGPTLTWLSFDELKMLLSVLCIMIFIIVILQLECEETWMGDAASGQNS